MDMVRKLGCTLQNPEDIVFAKKCGFDYLEFMGKYLVSLSRNEYLSLQRKLEDSSIRVLGINGYCPEKIRMAGPGFEPENIRKYAAECAERGGGLGAKIVGIGSPKSRDLPPGYSRSEAVLQLKEFLKITTEEFGKYGMTVCLEPLAPCYCNFINYLPEAAAVVEDLNLENLGIVVDFYNMEYVNEADLDLKSFVNLIRHAHISDDDGSCNRRSWLKTEKRKLHVRRVRSLYDRGYEGAITLETDCRFDRKQAAESLDILRNAMEE